MLTKLFFPLWTVIILFGQSINASSSATTNAALVDHEPKLNWIEDMYPAAIAEAWLKFIQSNKRVIGGVEGKDLLGRDFKKMLDDLCCRLLVRSVLTNQDQVDGALNNVSTKLRLLKNDYNLEFDGIEELFESLRENLLIMMNRVRPEKNWELLKKVGKFFGISRPEWTRWTKTFPPKIPIRLPREGSEWLLIQTSIPTDAWIEVMLRVVDSLLLILDTSKMLGVTDFSLFQKVFTAKFQEMYPIILGVVRRQPIRIFTPAPQIHKQSPITMVPNNIPRVLTLDLTHKEGEQPSQSSSYKGGNIIGGVTLPKKSTRPSPVASLNEPDYRSEILQLRKVLDVLLEESGASKNPNLKFGRPGNFCTAKQIHTLITTSNVGVQVMDTFMRAIIMQKPPPSLLLQLGHIPSIAYEKLSLGKEQEFFTILRRSSILLTKTSRLLLFPISMGSYWLLTIIQLSQDGTGQVKVYNPLRPIDEGKMIEIAQKVQNGLDRYQTFRLPGSAIGWKDSVIGPLSESITTRSPIHSGGLVMGWARAATSQKDLESPFSWRISLLTAAIDIIKTRDIKSLQTL